MVLSKRKTSWEPAIEDFLRLRHCGIFNDDGLRKYLVSKGVRHYPTIYFKVDSEYEEVLKGDKDYDANYPYRLKSMHIGLGSDDGYYAWTSEELETPDFYSGLIDYFERKDYPLEAFMRQGGCDDAQKIDQLFYAMIRDGFKMYSFRFIES